MWVYIHPLCHKTTFKLDMNLSRLLENKKDEVHCKLDILTKTEIHPQQHSSFYQTNITESQTIINILMSIFSTFKQ